MLIEPRLITATNDAFKRTQTSTEGGFSSSGSKGGLSLSALRGG